MCPCVTKVETKCSNGFEIQISTKNCAINNAKSRRNLAVSFEKTNRFFTLCYEKNPKYDFNLNFSLNSAKPATQL